MRLAAGDRVLVRLPRWLGDAVMAEPAVAALAGRVGPSNLTLAGPPALVALLAEGLPGVRVASPRADAGWRGHAAAVLFTGSFRSAWDAWRAGVPVRAGWSRDGRGWLLTHGARPAREVGRTPLGLGRRGRFPRHLPRPFGAACAELVGWLGVPVRRTRPRLAVPAEARARRDLRAASAGWLDTVLDGIGGDHAALPSYALLNAGARPGSAKAWPAASWVALAAALAERGRRLVLAAGPGEEAALEPVLAAVAGRTALALVDPVADLGELAAWIEGADVVVTADSGPRHLALALDRPLAVVAGPTDPRHTADHLARTRLVRTPVDCGPCHRERCPLAGERHERCMHAVEPGRLVEAALQAEAPEAFGNAGVRPRT